jgi:charged multivesicular body protein 2A
MAAMNRGMNLPQIQRIMNDFEREGAAMDMKEEMMTDAIDDAMDDGELEDEETEGDNILKQVLEEIGVDLSQQVPASVSVGIAATNGCAQLTDTPSAIAAAPVRERQPVVLGETAGPPAARPPGGDTNSGTGGGGGGGGGTSDEDALQARLDALRKG